MTIASRQMLQKLAQGTGGQHIKPFVIMQLTNRFASCGYVPYNNAYFYMQWRLRGQTSGMPSPLQGGPNKSTQHRLVTL